MERDYDTIYELVTSLRTAQAILEKIGEQTLAGEVEQAVNTFEPELDRLAEEIAADDDAYRQEVEWTWNHR